MSPPVIALETLSVNGRSVIPAREAARRTGWTTSYIAILCREAKLAGVRLSSGWFVEENSLEQFLKERTDRKREQHEELRTQRQIEFSLNQPAASVAASATSAHSALTKSTAALLFIFMVFPFAALASQLSAHDVTKLVNRIRKIHERGIRVSGYLHVKTIEENAA
jgi:hypothetical protein